MHITSAKFIKSASKVSECPLEEYPEFALVGRSNVGKSSLINMLVQRNGLAKSSVTPGKTQLINYFLINDARYLVDLPGYGYAKKSKEERIHRMDVMQHYVMHRPQRIFVLIDGSIPPQKIDLEFLKTIQEEQIAFDIIITKADKLNQKDLHKNSEILKTSFQTTLGILPMIFQSSSTKGRGRKEILDYIEKNIPIKI